MRWALGLACLLALPLLAWEPSTGKAAEGRAAELEKVLKERPLRELVELKEERARQEGEPAWIKKTAWRIAEGGKTYLFGVGSAHGVKLPSLRFTVAETKARAALVSMTGKTTVERGSAEGKTRTTTTTEGETSAQPIDWYDAADGTLWALVVEIR